MQNAFRVLTSHWDVALTGMLFVGIAAMVFYVMLPRTLLSVELDTFPPDPKHADMLIPSPTERLDLPAIPERLPFESSATEGGSIRTSKIHPEKSHLPDVLLTVDINRASQTDLERLPGIGPKLAGRIIQYRQQYGAFKQLTDLLGVRGIGPKSLHRLKPYLTIH